VVGITPEDAVDNFAVLAALAGKAAEWATERITPPELDELHDLALAVEWTAEDVVAANWRFHRALNLASGSPRLLTYLRQAVRVVPASYFELFPEQVHRSRADHAALLDAIDRGDAAMRPGPSTSPTSSMPVPRWATGCGPGAGTRIR
jgi:DNA-binding GntR family transcriptional regulator